MPTFDEIITSIPELTSLEKAKLLDALWDAMCPEELALPSEQWVAEAQRRSAAYDQGQMTATPWPEVKPRARRKAGLDG